MVEKNEIVEIKPAPHWVFIQMKWPETYIKNIVGMNIDLPSSSYLDDFPPPKA